ncbi:hypothetical protein L596_017376 [Steinernema carpocapsae]|uniref:Uncharacterized protein n=1 Tax=Steinernema carpocapsae TaxID=34508 RepID=A0A4U5N288_STECR|nr:hypothetical protein L596_017376 [Steinernema carpocapsae]
MIGSLSALLGDRFLVNQTQLPKKPSPAVARTETLFVVNLYLKGRRLRIFRRFLSARIALIFGPEEFSKTMITILASKWREPVLALRNMAKFG